MDRFGDAPRPESEEGQGLVEYGLIIALIGIIIIAVMMALGPQIRDFFEQDIDEAAVEEPVESLEQELDETDGETTMEQGDTEDE